MLVASFLLWVYFGVTDVEFVVARVALGLIIYTHLSSDTIMVCPFEAAVLGTLVSLQSYGGQN
jgi:hypothetical protein